MEGNATRKPPGKRKEGSQGEKKEDWEGVPGTNEEDTKGGLSSATVLGVGEKKKDAKTILQCLIEGSPVGLGFGEEEVSIGE